MDVDMNIAEIPPDPAQRWEWIKYQLRARDASLAKLSRELGVSGQAVKNVKRTAYPRIERAIAKALGLTPVQIWPERWSVHGAPHRLRPSRPEQGVACNQDHNPACVLRHRKNGAEG